LNVFFVAFCDPNITVPEITPLVFLHERMSNKVVFPAPLGPIIADIDPFSKTVETLSNNRMFSEFGDDDFVPGISKHTESTITGVECLVFVFEKNSDAEEDFIIFM
jgi:hypothetical protein